MRDGRRPVGGDMSRSPRQFAPPPTKVCLSRGWPITIGSGFPVTVGISYLLRSNQWLEPCYGAAQFAARCQRRSGVQAQRRESGHPGPALVRHHREPQLGEVVEIKSDIFPLEGRPARAERVLLH